MEKVSESESGINILELESRISTRVLERGEIFWNRVNKGRISILALQNWTSIRVLERWTSDLELGGGAK